MRNYVQVGCYLSKRQKEGLDILQEKIWIKSEFRIPTTELIRDAVARFLKETDEDIVEYIVEKRLFSGDFK